MDMTSFLAGVLAGAVGLGAIVTGVVILIASRLPGFPTDDAGDRR